MQPMGSVLILPGNWGPAVAPFIGLAWSNITSPYFALSWKFVIKNSCFCRVYDSIYFMCVMDPLPPVMIHRKGIWNCYPVLGDWGHQCALVTFCENNHSDFHLQSVILWGSAAGWKRHWAWLSYLMQEKWRSQKAGIPLLHRVTCVNRQKSIKTAKNLPPTMKILRRY